MRIPNRNDLVSLSIRHAFRFTSRPGNWKAVLVLFALFLVVLLSAHTAPVLALKTTGAETNAIPLNREAGPSESLTDNLLFTRSVRVRPRALDGLVKSLQTPRSVGERFLVMTSLEQMGDAAIPALINALDSPEPDLRVAGSEILGWQRAAQAVGPLLAATFDSRAAVREAAVSALGAIADLQALPRIQQLQISEGNYYVQQAAYIAEQQINSVVAEQLGIGASELHASAVAPSGHLAYAVTSQGLYVRRDGVWSPVANLPAQPTGVLATDVEGAVVFAGTSAGLYRSLNSGETWESVQEQLPNGENTRATALALNPQDARQVFVALNGTFQNHAAMGIYSSADGGSTWQLLPGSPNEYVTTRLNFDPSLSPYLFGATGVGVWRYALTGNGTFSGTN